MPAPGLGLPDAIRVCLFDLDGVLTRTATVHFAAWKKHLGMYPVPTLDPELEAEIAPYRVAKDSVNFPYKNPIPYELIERVSAAIYAKRGAAD